MSSKKMAIIAMIAAIYCGLTVVLSPISYGPIQVRLSECLTLLPLFYYPSVYGVTLGCFLANLVGVFTGANILGVMDVFFGTLATFFAALLTYNLRDVKIKGYPLLSILMPVIMNGLIIGAECAYAYYPDTLLAGFVINCLQVALGEAIAVFVLYPVVKTLAKRVNFNKYE